MTLQPPNVRCASLSAENSAKRLHRPREFCGVAFCDLDDRRCTTGGQVSGSFFNKLSCLTLVEDLGRIANYCTAGGAEHHRNRIKSKTS